MKTTIPFIMLLFVFCATPFLKIESIDEKAKKESERYFRKDTRPKYKVTYTIILKGSPKKGENTTVYNVKEVIIKNGYIKFYIDGHYFYWSGNYSITAKRTRIKPKGNFANKHESTTKRFF